MSLEVVRGDLLQATEQFICHQCNCVTNRSAHLARIVFQHFPYADIYSKRVIPDELGNIVIRGNGKDQRYVIALLGQYYPGRSKYPRGKKDGVLTREVAFMHCLDKVLLIKNLRSVAFPWKIGCGAAGGDWETYRRLIKFFAELVKSPVKIYQLP